MKTTSIKKFVDLLKQKTSGLSDKIVQCRVLGQTEK